MIDACRAKLARTRKVLVGNKGILTKIYDSNAILVDELSDQRQRYLFNDLSLRTEGEDKENVHDSNLEQEEKAGKKCTSS